MDTRTLRWGVFSIAAAGLVAAGCGSSSSSSGGGGETPPPTSTNLQAVLVSTAPSGPGDSAWGSIPVLEVESTNQSTSLLYGDGQLNMSGTFGGLSEFNGGVAPGLKLQAAYDDVNLYIRAEWQDDDFNLDRRRWLYDGAMDPLKSGESAAGWTSQLNDDKLGVAFAIDAADTITSSVAGDGESFATQGCAAACHVTADGLDMRSGSGSVDVWHFKTSRSDPLGYVQDQNTNETDGRKGDAGTGMENRHKAGDDNRSGPLFVWDGTSQVVTAGPRAGETLDPAYFLLDGHLADARGDADSGAALYTVGCAGCHGASGEGGVAAALNTADIARKSETTLRGFMSDVGSHAGAGSWNGLTSAGRDDVLLRIRGMWGIPGYFLGQPEGSVADVQAFSEVDYSNVTNLLQDGYSLMIKRALNTGNADDAQFDPAAGGEIPFGVALMDNDGRNHVGSNLEMLEFIQ